jgi:hypothetical protein
MTGHLPRILSACVAPAMFLLAAAGPASAADGCGVGCHATIFGACVVDGWGTGARVWNQCPTTSRSRPPCGGGDFVWDSRKKACFQRSRDWL